MSKRFFIFWIVVIAVAATGSFWLNGSLEQVTGSSGLVLGANAHELPLAENRHETGVLLPVLTYHYIRVVENPASDRLGFDLSVTPDNLDAQLKFLTDSGWTTVTPQDLYDAMAGKSKLADKSILLTFDDGYADFYTNAFPILKKYNVKATVFVVPGFLSEADGRYMTWEQVRELDQSGLVTIAAHTMHHVDLVKKAVEAPVEIVDSKTTLEDFLGHPVEVFAYPYGYFDQHTIELVKQAGFDMAFTTQYGARHDLLARLAISRVRVTGNLDLTHFVKRLEKVIGK